MHDDQITPATQHPATPLPGCSSVARSRTTLTWGLCLDRAASGRCTWQWRGRRGTGAAAERLQPAGQSTRRAVHAHTSAHRLCADAACQHMLQAALQQHVMLHPVPCDTRYAVKSMPKRFLGEYLEPHFVARIQHEVGGRWGACWAPRSLARIQHQVGGCALGQPAGNRTRHLHPPCIVDRPAARLRARRRHIHSGCHPPADVYRHMGQSLHG
jgi:hypothetical protein